MSTIYIYIYKKKVTSRKNVIAGNGSMDQQNRIHRFLSASETWNLFRSNHSIAGQCHFGYQQRGIGPWSIRNQYCFEKWKPSETRSKSHTQRRTVVHAIPTNEQTQRRRIPERKRFCWVAIGGRKTWVRERSAADKVSYGTSYLWDCFLIGVYIWRKQKEPKNND